VFTDFDGTLAPIVDDPDRALPLPGAVEMLGRLADRYGRVAVVSGRSVRYLQRRLQVPGDDVASRLVLVGLYGLERADGGELLAHPDAAPWAPIIERIGQEAADGAPAGVGVERKGLTLSLHARRAPEHLAWIEAFAADASDKTGLEITAGKMLLELRPPIAVDKGTVVEEMAAGLEAVCFAGDDVGDLAAFAALARLRAAGVATLAVAVRSDESPPALLDEADLIVDGPSGVLALFGRFVAS
jgi:trehalose 6-phosphate phosphatase